MTTATLVYEAPQGFTSIAKLSAKMAAVPLPLAAIAALGGYVTSDVTAAGGTGVRRTIVITLTPSVAPAAHVTLSPGTPSGSFINGTVIDNAGADLVLPPQVDLSGGGDNIIEPGRLRGYLSAANVALIGGGTGYNGTTFASVIGGMAPPVAPHSGLFVTPACVQSLKLIEVGAHYTSGAVVQFQGGLAPGGVHATAVCTVNATTGRVLSVQLTSPGGPYNHAPEVFIYNPSVPQAQGAKVVARMGAGTPATVNITVALGVVTALSVATPGDGYVSVPELLIFDPTGTGSGATARMRMALGRLDIVNAGRGYKPAPSVVLTPVFNALFPPGSDRTKPFRQLMTAAFAQASVGPIVAALPVIA